MSKCNFCEDLGDRFDFLTECNFCSGCFSELSKTARHIYFKHATDKLKQRYGIDLTIAVYNEIVSQIMNTSTSTLISDGNSRSRKIHKVVIDGVKIFVVYKKGKRGAKGAIVTALPKSTFIRGIKIK